MDSNDSGVDTNIIHVNETMSFLLNSPNSMNHDKAQIGMVTRNMPHLVIVIFSDEVVKMKILLQYLDRYLLSVVRDNRYLPRGSKEKVLSITITGSVTMSR